jgi:hypothetical protein
MAWVRDSRSVSVADMHAPHVRPTPADFREPAADGEFYDRLAPVSAGGGRRLSAEKREGTRSAAIIGGEGGREGRSNKMAAPHADTATAPPPRAVPASWWQTQATHWQGGGRTWQGERRNSQGGRKNWPGGGRN